jgi:hypothetical protein
MHVNFASFASCNWFESGRGWETLSVRQFNGCSTCCHYASFIPSDDKTFIIWPLIYNQELIHYKRVTLYEANLWPVPRNSMFSVQTSC